LDAVKRRVGERIELFQEKNNSVQFQGWGGAGRYSRGKVQDERMFYE